MPLSKWLNAGPTGPWSAGPTGVTGPITSYGDESPWEDTKKRDLAFKWVMDTLTDGEVNSLRRHFIREDDKRTMVRTEKMRHGRREEHFRDAMKYVTKGVWK